MPPLRWKEVADVPPSRAAVLAALQFHGCDTGGLGRLTDQEWQVSLDFCDRAQITLILHQRCAHVMPARVEERVKKNIISNRERYTRLREEYLAMAQRLDAGGVAHTVLKGFTHAPLFVSAPEYRLQADLDLLVGESDLEAARSILLHLGFEADDAGGVPADHLPPFMRKTGWRWDGDFFDPKRPAVVELHHRLWDDETELFAVEGLEEFPKRKQEAMLDGLPLPSFCAPDQLGYACLHAMRHLLRGSLKIFHVYEIAYFLDGQASQEDLWRDWRHTHAPSLRRLEAVACGLAEAWFGCRLPGALEEEIRQLPAPVGHWLDRYAASPVAALARPNKDELWLHLSLLTSWKSRRRVLRRRLAPLTLPGHVDANFVPDRKLTPALQVGKWAAYARFLLSRLVFHARAAVSLLAGGAVWWRMHRGGAE